MNVETSIKIRKEKFKKHSILIRIDNDLHISNEMREKIDFYLKFILSDIADEDMLDKYSIIDKRITVAVYKGDEHDVCESLKDILQSKV